MIRNAVIHVANEQPMLADLLATPTSSDVSLLCTNLRTMNGTRPVFVDDQYAVFVFPYSHIRFLEVPAGSSELSPDVDDPAAMAARANGGRRADEAGQAAQAPDADADGELELDEDFLRRIREV